MLPEGCQAPSCAPLSLPPPAPDAAPPQLTLGYLMKGAATSAAATGRMHARILRIQQLQTLGCGGRRMLASAGAARRASVHGPKVCTTAAAVAMHVQRTHANCGDTTGEPVRSMGRQYFWGLGLGARPPRRRRRRHGNAGNMKAARGCGALCRAPGAAGESILAQRGSSRAGALGRARPRVKRPGRSKQLWTGGQAAGSLGAAGLQI